jgi:foldase protein PrsA
MNKIKKFFSNIKSTVSGWFKRESKEENIDIGNDENGSSQRNYSKIALVAMLVLVVVFLLAGSVFAIGIYKYDWQNRPTEIAKKTFPFPAAMVGLKSITINQVEQEADRLEHFFNQTDQGDQAPDESVMKNQILERLIEEQVIKNLANKNDVSVSSEEVDKQYQTIAEQNGGKEKLEALLAELYNLEPSEFKELILRQLRMEELKQKFENELRKKVKVKHILIKVDEDASKKEINKAKEKAQDLLDRIKNKGVDFGKLAEKHSQDKSSKDDGGALPWFGKGDMVEDFEKAAFGLDIGEVSDLVKTSYGYHLIKLEERRGEIENNFTNWVDEMKNKWFAHKFIKW